MTKHGLMYNKSNIIVIVRIAELSAFATKVHWASEVVNQVRV